MIATWVRIALSSPAAEAPAMDISSLQMDESTIMSAMTLLTLRDAQLAYGDFPLLDHAQLSVQDGERIGLIGRNGTGKSTLLKVLTGAAILDDGAIERQDGLRIAFVEQEPVLPAPPDEHDWKLAMYLERFEVDLVRAAATGSGGERKRAALAAAFASQPDLLLLDEPTNHLDIVAIETLQELIPEARAALIITHDREFLDRIATRIVELDRGVLRSYQGNFSRYQEIKELELASEGVSNSRFDKLLAQEEVWIRKGVEARRTRNEGRVLRLEQLRRERAARRRQIDADPRDPRHTGAGFRHGATGDQPQYRLL